MNTFDAYPHLWHKCLKERFPCAVFNVIVTAIGGEHSESGAARFASDVLSLRPDVVTVDYGLNDRALGPSRARDAWERMVSESLAAGARVILLTPTWDDWSGRSGERREDALTEHAGLIREIAADMGVGLADPYTAFERSVDAGRDLKSLLSWPNHPNREGHRLVVDELMRWVPLTAATVGKV